MKTVEQVKDYRRHIIRYVERKCQKHRLTTTVLCLYNTTDDDIVYWDRCFKSCKRGRRFGDVEFELGEKQQ